MISVRRAKLLCDRYTEIENYEDAVNSPAKYVCHHRREVQNGVKIWSRDELISVGQYYSVEPEDLIFMPMGEHVSLHMNAYDPKRKCLCKAMSDEQKEKLSRSRKGRAPWNKGKTGAQSWSKESKEKLSNTLARPEVKAKIYTFERNKKISISKTGKKQHLYSEV